jgi:hypothetical protein
LEECRFTSTDFNSEVTVSTDWRTKTGQRLHVCFDRAGSRYGITPEVIGSCVVEVP